MRTASFAALIAALLLFVTSSDAQPPTGKVDPKAKTDPKAKGKSEPLNMKLTVADIRLGKPVLGPTLEPSDLKGRAVLFDKWGIECGPCLAAMPHTADLNSELADFGLLIIGAHSQGGEADKVRAVALSHRANFPIQVNSAVTGDEYRFLPHCLLFDHTGACVFRGLPTEVEPQVRKAVGAAIVAAAGREKWTSSVEPIVKELKAGKSPATLLARVSAMRNHAGDAGDDAKALLASLTAVGRKKLEQAAEKKDSEPIEAFLLIEKVPAAYKGSPLATEANELLTKLMADKAVKAELSSRQSFEVVKKLDQQLGLGADDPRKPEWQKAHKEPLTELKKKVQAMKKSWPDAKSTQDAVVIAERYGVELK